MISEHATAEKPDQISSEKTGRTVTQWTEKPGHNNDLGDCLVGCLMFAQRKGAKLPDGQLANRPKTRESKAAKRKKESSKPTPQVAAMETKRVKKKESKKARRRRRRRAAELIA